jgi:carbon monoxide dehydrogenase subunit G
VIFEDTIAIKAPASRVWDLLTDVNRFAGCVPGVQDVKQVDDHTFTGTILAAVGPISGNFNFTATITESAPPTSMVTELDGTDSVTRSNVKARTTLSLAPTGEQETAFTYTSNVDIQGRLAILGDMVMRATATLVLEEFVNRLRRELEQ